MRWIAVGLVVVAAVLGACRDGSAPTTTVSGEDAVKPAEEARPTAAPTKTATAAPLPTQSPTATATPVRIGSTATATPTVDSKATREPQRTVIPVGTKTMIVDPLYECGPSLFSPISSDTGKVHFLHWTSDASRLIFNHNEKLWSVDAEGSVLQELVDANPVEEGGFKGYGMEFSFYADPSPDGSQIIYSTCQYNKRKGYQYAGFSERSLLGYELALVDIDGSEPQRLTRDSDFDHLPVWSPDGTKIAFISGVDYYGYSLADTQQRVIDVDTDWERDEGMIITTAPASLYPAVWSPDSQRLAITTSELKDNSITRAIQTVRSDGSELRSLGEATTMPSWSPDGKRLVYGHTDEERAAIYTVRYDGSELTRIWSGKPDDREWSIESVTWSPDGAEILVVPSWSGWPWVLTPDGKETRRMGPSKSKYPRAVIQDAVWSPDGSKIAAVSGYDPYEGDDLMIFTLDRNGADLRVLVGTRSSEESGEVDGIEIFPTNPERTIGDVDVSVCSKGFVVINPEEKPGLVRDCEVLLGIRDRLAGRAQLNWGSGLPILEWEGIELGGDPLRVKKLEFENRGLTGIIPPEIGKLDELTSIHLRGGSEFGPNLLRGPIPAELGNLTKLEELSLRGSLLSGNIPSELGNLSNLRALVLSNNFLNGSIPKELGDLSKLEWLLLGENYVSGGIPAELTNLGSLVGLGIERNSLSGNIPTELGELENLGFFDLIGNAFDGCIPDELRKGIGSASRNDRYAYEGANFEFCSEVEAGGE